MNLSRAHIQSRVHAFPILRFEQQRLTSFAGSVILQALFQRLDLKSRLERCFRFVDGRMAYGSHLLFLQLVLQLMVGFRFLRDRDLYDKDPLLLRVLGVRRLPDVSTLSRRLSTVPVSCVEEVRAENRALLLRRLTHEKLARVTLDFDGSVQSTRRHAEGTAVGFNRKRKGERSYYPLFCTVAQTGQFLDYHHRPGNVHDSNGAGDFLVECIAAVRAAAPSAVLESRMDAAFFDEHLVRRCDDEGLEFSVSLPFERFPQLKGILESTTSWTPIDDKWSYSEISWAPKCWTSRFRILLLRRRTETLRKGPLQLDLFEPRSFEYEFKAIVTNKRCGAPAILRFHNGRGSQEGLLGEATSGTHLDYVPVRRRVGNQLFTAASLLAHNLGREMQMIVKPRLRPTTRKRKALWDFETLDHLRKRLLQRAGRLTFPQGELTLTISANDTAKNEILHYVNRLRPTG